MSEHYPVLLVVLPLLAAPICLLLRHGTASRILAVLVAWTCLAMAVEVLNQVTSGESISYMLGGWAAPYGIEYRVDTLNAYLLVIVSMIASVVLPFGGISSDLTLRTDRLYLYHAAFLLCFCGLMGIAVTGDLFNIFVFLEVSSLSSYTLIGLGKGRRALRAAFS